MARKVFVGSLPPDISEEALRGASEVCERLGVVLECL